MSSDADLSTGDLAKPGGVNGPEATRAEGQGFARSAGAGASPVDQGSTVTGVGGAERAQGPGAQGWDDGSMPAQDADPGQPLGQGAGTRQGVEPAGTAAAQSGAPGGAGADVALLDPADGERFRQRWNDVQARFVDDPREAVQTADGLVAELMQSLAGGFNQHKSRLESAWQSGDDPDTEELRQALQRYRSFFDRLLST